MVKYDSIKHFLSQDDVYRFLKTINPPDVAMKMAIQVTEKDLRLMESYIRAKYTTATYSPYLDEALLLVFTSL